MNVNEAFQRVRIKPARVWKQCMCVVVFFICQTRVFWSPLLLSSPLFHLLFATETISSLRAEMCGVRNGAAFWNRCFLPNENEWTRATAHTRTLEAVKKPPRSFTDSSGRQLGDIKKAKLFSNEKPESSFEIQEKRTAFRQMTWYAVRLTTTLSITALADELISQFRDFEELLGFLEKEKQIERRFGIIVAKQHC